MHPSLPTESKTFDVFFLLHEQYLHFEMEPAYNEVFKPFQASGYVDRCRTFVYQRRIKDAKIERDKWRQCEKNGPWLHPAAMDRLVSRYGQKKIVVYCAGGFTRSLLADENGLNRLNVVALADSDERLWDRQIGGYSIVSPEKILEYSDTVLIVSGQFEDEIEASLKRLHGTNVLVDRIFNYSHKSASAYADRLFDRQIKELEEAIFREIDRFQPQLIVLALTFPGENLRGEFLAGLRAAFPRTKIYVQTWDLYDHAARFIEFEKSCFRYSHMVGIVDSYSRFQAIRTGQGIYGGYPCRAKAHWHPTVHDPGLYQKKGKEKIYDLVMLGSAENRRKAYIDYLSHIFPERFFHFGSLLEAGAYISFPSYVRILNQTKIFVNTQTYADRLQLKGKVREALSVGTFILEEDNPETRAFVKEGRGVVYFQGKQDLREKVAYYLSHQREREAIADRGYRWYRKHHNAKLWVREILKRTKLLKDPGTSSPEHRY